MLTISPSAQEMVKSLLDNAKDKQYLGIRISLKTKGCSGLSYQVEFAKQKEEFDEEIDFDNFKVFIDPKATLYIVGMEMDYLDSKLESGFIFKNPNEKGRCGCGESFHV